MPGYGSISGKNICDRVYKKKQPGENMFPGCFFFTERIEEMHFPIRSIEIKNPVKEGSYFRNRIKDKKDAGDGT